MKRFLSILLAFALLVGCAFVLTACDDEPDPTPTPDEKPDEKPSTVEGADYTVTVLDHQNRPIEGLTLKFVYEDKMTGVLATGADGKATAKLTTERDVKVEFVDLKGFGAPSAKKATFESMETELTITLNPNITVIVVDENGVPIPGVSVQICHDNGCMLPIDTNTEGKAVMAFAPKGKLKVGIASVPNGYAKPEPLPEPDDAYHKYFEDGSYTVTVVIPFA